MGCTCSSQPDRPDLVATLVGTSMISSHSVAPGGLLFLLPVCPSRPRACSLSGAASAD